MTSKHTIDTNTGADTHDNGPAVPEFQTAMAGNLPQPPPKPEGREVFRELVIFLLKLKMSRKRVAQAIELISARDAFGRAKYGQPLMTTDGRDDIEEAVQEIGDAMMYIHKAKMNGKDLKPVREHLAVLNAMVKDTGPSDD